MSDYINQIGVAGLLVILILRELFSFLRRSDDQSPTLRETLNTMTQILREMQESGLRRDTVMNKLYDESMRHGFLLDSATVAIDRLRLSNHAISGSVQKLVDRDSRS